MKYLHSYNTEMTFNLYTSSEKKLSDEE